jgi:hypothetical protein
MMSYPAVIKMLPAPMATINAAHNTGACRARAERAVNGIGMTHRRPLAESQPTAVNRGTAAGQPRPLAGVRHWRPMTGTQLQLMLVCASTPKRKGLFDVVGRTVSRLSAASSWATTASLVP